MNKKNKPYKLLLVDDNHINIKMLMDVFDRTNYELFLATNGRTALEISKAERPDLVLLDITMPEMDGYEVCERLMADKETAEIPVIFITAKSEVDDETIGLEAGAVDYITKPFNADIVRSRVNTHLSLRTAYKRLEEQYLAMKETEQLKQDIEIITRHDLKSPLNGIIGIASFLLSNETLPRQKQINYYKHISDIAIRLRGMLNQSLDLVKMEQGLYQVTLQYFNILPMIITIIDDAKRLGNHQSVIATILLQGKPLAEGDQFVILGEEQLCHTMLTNLIWNALEASQEKSKVTVSLWVTNEKAKIAIHNHGAVPPKIREDFFKKFVTYGKTNGTGLGTYSALLMAEAQKGSIQMQTSDKKGTTVTVELVRGWDSENSYS